MSRKNKGNKNNITNNMTCVCVILALAQYTSQTTDIVASQFVDFKS